MVNDLISYAYVIRRELEIMMGLESFQFGDHMEIQPSLYTYPVHFFHLTVPELYYCIINS